jgi:hypothetical protein
MEGRLENLTSALSAAQAALAAEGDRLKAETAAKVCPDVCIGPALMINKSITDRLKDRVKAETEANVCTSS